MPPDQIEGGSRDWRLRIEDMLEAIARIQRYTAGMSAADFAANELVLDAVIRNFAIIGEAAGHLPAAVTDQYPQVPWRVMSRMRNILVHQYFGVSIPILWETLQVDLPPLVEPLQRLLAERDPST
jgi:uncharacterized protein with HEPN domain